MYDYVLELCFFFFKQKTAYEMRISDWSSDVCSSDLAKMYLAAIKEGVEIRHCRVPTLGIWSAGDAYLWEDQIKDSSKLMAAPWGYVRLDQEIGRASCRERVCQYV